MILASEDVLVPPDFSSCNRRLSRAARRIVYDALRQSPIFREEKDSFNFWDLLDQSLLLQAHTDQSCPLLYDVLREEEQNIMVEAAPLLRRSSDPLLGRSIAGRRQQRQKDNARSTWYRCGHCHKLFSSRYYLRM